MNSFNQSRLLKNFQIARLNIVRYRFKKKWAEYRKDKSPSEHALAHFDRFYTQVYGNLWPSIRVSLLSQQKYCALVNNFADHDAVMNNLIELNTFDFIKYARHNLYKETSTSSPDDAKAKLLELNVVEEDADVDKEEESHLDLQPSDNQPNLHEFMPVTKIISERHQLYESEVDQNIYDQIGNTKFKKTLFPELKLPHHLHAMVQDRAEVMKFSPAKKDSSGKLEYYHMDAASLLPVLGLNLTEGCSVLDLCAAPGGKTLAMLQTLLPDTLCCVDHSWNRIGRLKDVLHWYTPYRYGNDEKIQIIHGNALDFGQQVAASDALSYDRVLVDVPCFTDRHVLHNDENNIFRPSRISDRLEIQHLQRDLLYWGVQCCRPGGYIVYSTCTLSMPQNDGIIQRTLDKLWQETNVEVAIKDTKVLADSCREVFNFYDKTRFGQLVVPNLTANFGPIYFCTLQRIS